MDSVERVTFITCTELVPILDMSSSILLALNRDEIWPNSFVSPLILLFLYSQIFVGKYNNA